MRTKKIVIEVLWKPTEAQRNSEILADCLVEAVEDVLSEREVKGAAFAHVVEG